MPGNPKILIIEDNELNIKLFCAILKDYELFVARTAEEGIESARRVIPDLILMDIQLPRMDGLTATRIIKSDARLTSVPVIAVTSLAMVGDREKVLSAGFEGYMSKPIEIETLKSTVAALLSFRSEPTTTVDTQGITWS